MKKILLFILVMGMSFSLTYGQGSKLPYKNTAVGEVYSQLWNLSNTYYCTITTTVTATNGSQLGQQKDTTVSTTAFYLSTAAFNKITPVVNCDTFTLVPFGGYGAAKFTVAAYKVSGTDTLTVTLQESSDGIIWTDVTQVTAAQTLYPTSLTVPTATEWILTVTWERFYRVKVVGNIAGVEMVQAWIHKTGVFYWH